MSAFQFTAQGIQPLAPDAPAVSTHSDDHGPGFPKFSPAVVPVFADAAVPVAPKKAPPSAPAPAPVFKTQNVSTLMRARLRDVEREIKRLKALEKERDELKRMLAAAKKPITNVRALNRAI